MPLAAATERLLAMASATPLVGTEVLPLEAADGRVLAEPLRATTDLPPWPNSAMDGYALACAAWAGEPMEVSQRIFAGHAPGPLQPGTCARIFTGAPLPEGADCVQMQENAEVGADGRVRFTEPLRVGLNVRPRAQECRAGETVLDAGTRLGPIELGLAATLGVPSLVVRRKPRVAVLSTGDELVAPGLPLGPGQIYNSNRQLLRSWLERSACEVLDAGIISDDLQLTRRTLDSLQDVDLILTTGGVSVGEADYLGQALREGGTLALWKLAIKPGKPLTVGEYQGTVVIGLPGNPASTLVTFALLARPYLLRRMGCDRVQPKGFATLAGFAWPPGNRREFLRARVEAGRAEIYSNQSSGVLRSAAWADGLVEVPEGQAIAEGDTVRFIPMSELLA
nr:gephyrin-like molybdotransferase Glp [Pseudomonas sp. RIT-PI-S]